MDGLLQAWARTGQDSRAALHNSETRREGILGSDRPSRLRVRAGPGSDSLGTSGFLIEGHLPFPGRTVLAHSQEIGKTKALWHYFYRILE